MRLLLSLLLLCTTFVRAGAQAPESIPRDTSPAWLGPTSPPSQADTALTRLLGGPGWELAYPADATAPTTIYEGQVLLGLEGPQRTYRLTLSTYANPAETPIRQWADSFCAHDLQTGCGGSGATLLPTPYPLGSATAQVIVNEGCDEKAYWFILGHGAHVVLLAFAEHDGSPLTREELRWMGLHIVRSFRWLP